MDKGKKKTHADLQMTGMAGEFLVAGKLFKRGLQVAVTMGNAKSIDIFAHNPKINRTFNVQVKTLRAKNCFLISLDSVFENYIYVFVLLHQVGQEEEFFIIDGKTILNDVEHFFGSSYRKPMPAINYGPMKEYKNNWELFTF